MQPNEQLTQSKIIHKFIKIVTHVLSDIIIALIVAFASIVPIIVRIREVPMTPEEMLLFDMETFFDLFSYYKSTLIIILASSAFALSLVYIAILLLKKQYKNFSFDITNFFAAIYLIMAVASSYFSLHYTIVTRGVYERYENIYVLIAYFVFFFCCRYFVNNRIKLKVVIYFLFLSSIVIGGIGFLQFIGKDPFATEQVKNIILAEYVNKIKSYDIIIKRVYSTLFNPNNVGVYTSMVGLLAIVLTVGLPFKGIGKYFAAAVSVLMLVCLLGSHSRAGYIAVIVGLILTAIICATRLIMHKKIKKLIIGTILTGGALFLFINAFFMAVSPEEKSRVIARFTSIFNQFNLPNPNYFKTLELENGDMHVRTAGGEIFFGYENGTLFVRGADDGNIITPYETIPLEDGYSEILNFNVEGFGEFQIENAADYAIGFSMRGVEIFFVIEEDDLVLLNDNFEPMEEVERYGFEGNEIFASSRGYIWSRSIPLLKETMILGHGPDTFAFYFPQNDIFGKLMFHGNKNIIVDKPHSFYLQTGINTGVISLAAILIIFVIYIVKSFYVLIVSRCEDKFYVCAGFALFAANIGYMVSSIADDSLVSVAPVFWTLFGLGFAVNKKLENSRRKLND